MTQMEQPEKPELLKYIQLHKTSDIIAASVISGAMCGGAGGDDLKSLEVYAVNAGLAFQIMDDILDATGTREKLGKTAGKDQEQDKLTYPALYGIEKSRAAAEELIKEALGEMERFGSKAEGLKGIARFIISRDY
jgi:geranylgeranyl diphosphate synthase, type II